MGRVPLGQTSGLKGLELRHPLALHLSLANYLIFSLILHFSEAYEIKKEKKIYPLELRMMVNWKGATHSPAGRKVVIRSVIFPL